MIPKLLRRLVLQIRIHVTSIDIDDIEHMLRNRPPHKSAVQLVNRLSQQYQHRHNLIQRLEKLK